jgi:hypothetical protein
MSSAEASLWQIAMNEEMETQKVMGTYEEVALPHGAHVIPCRWVYQEKRDSDGNVARYKARLVAKGFREREGIDYEETYAPTPSKVSILTLIAIAVAMDWEIAQFDVKAAFLYGELDEEIYLHPPVGYPTMIEGGVWRMKKSIYGLKQAAACWYQKLSEELAKGQFYSMKDPSVFCSASKDTVLASHVDDIICIARTKAARERARIMLEKPFSPTRRATCHSSLPLQDPNILTPYGMSFTTLPVPLIMPSFLMALTDLTLSGTVTQTGQEIRMTVALLLVR